MNLIKTFTINRNKFGYVVRQIIDEFFRIVKPGVNKPEKEITEDDLIVFERKDLERKENKE